MVTLYVVLKWLHVLSAAYLVGSIVTEWALRAYATKAKERTARTFVWEFLVKGEEVVAIPLAGLLLVSGLGMVFGPAAGGWSFTRDMWLAGGAGLFVVILVLMAVVASGAAKRAHAAYASNADESTAAPHTRTYAIVSSIATVLVVAAVWLMVAKPF